jgi:hypothetical protein
MRHFGWTLAALGYLGMGLLGGQALAHTPYLLPNVFDADRDRITLQGALTEDDYFNPDVPLNAPVVFETTPGGQTVEVKPAAALKDETLVEAPLTDAGTYRFSTGQMVGRKTTLANVGGKWLMVRQPRPNQGGGPGAQKPGGPGGEGGPPNSIAPADVPAGAQTMTSEGVMVVETYVTKGAPSDAALKTTGKGFELKPLTHPNGVYVDQGFGFQLLLDGRPVAGAPIAVYRGGNKYDDKRIAIETRSDAKGMVKLAFDRPGAYMLTTRWPSAERKPGEAPPERSYTYSLTFEVTR